MQPELEIIRACKARGLPVAGAMVGQQRGQFSYDSLATTDGLGDPLCYDFGSSQIENDVWYDWTAPYNGEFTVSVTVTDEDGGSTTVERTLVVNNVAPVITSVPDSGPVLLT